jgi:RHS repeat-associated protein
VAVDDKSCYNYADQLTYSTDANIGTPEYDDHGNTTSFSGNGTPLVFGYNANDHNISVTQGSKRTEYLKTVTGDVLRKKEFNANQLTSSYRYVTGGAVLQTCSLTDDNNCTTVDRYLALPGNVSLTLSPNNQDTGKRVVYSLHNYHGDTALTLTTEGKTTASTNTLLAYGAFGEQLVAGTLGTTTASAINATDSTMGWAADPTRKQEGGYTTSFIQMGARVYIPTLGRFLQNDPIDGGTLNNYVYVADPINSSDYSGRWGIGDWWASAIATVRAVVKAVVTPTQANVRAAFSAVVNFISPRRSAAPSSGGGRPAAKSSPKLVAQNKPTFRSGVDVFNTKNTQPPRQASPGPAISFDPMKAITTAVDFAEGGAATGAILGCAVGAIEISIIASPAAAPVGCLGGGTQGATIGGIVGSGIGFIVGGFGLPGDSTFDWGPGQAINPFKKR